MNPTVYKMIAIIIAWLVLSTGCGSTESHTPYCEEKVNVLASTQVTSSLMEISADQLIDSVGTQIVTEASYSDSESVLTQTPLGGQTELTIDMTYSNGEIREIDSVYHAGSLESNVNCVPRIEVDMQLIVSTADGALNESWPGVLSKELDKSPVLSAEFDPDGPFAGSFEIVKYNDPASPMSVAGMLKNYFHDNGSTGEMEISVEFRTKDYVGVSEHDALEW